ncbi:hypothetical protein NDU88_007269 [Pleurodeles waltl]|uniref:Uncharacterized protein n=1 Tax=Pleurodeles waltl TaxID=8319 RepID=A0AAV7UPE2_PLEWA|nr:hypothetical protein NDU88_007269 [Pleurodeles waltl]
MFVQSSEYSSEAREVAIQCQGMNQDIITHVEYAWKALLNHVLEHFGGTRDAEVQPNGSPEGSGGVEPKPHGGWLLGDATHRKLMLKTDASRRRKSHLPGYSRLEIQEPVARPADGSRGLKLERAPARGRSRLTGALKVPEEAPTCREQQREPRSDAPQQGKRCVLLSRPGAEGKDQWLLGMRQGWAAEVLRGALGAQIVQHLKAVDCATANVGQGPRGHPSTPKIKKTPGQAQVGHTRTEWETGETAPA